MATRKRNGQFAKRGSSKRSGGGKRRSTSLVVREHVTIGKRSGGGKRRGGGGGGGGGLAQLGKTLLAAAALGYVTDNVPAADAFIDKIPGSSKFGRPAAIGALALLVDRFVKRSPTLKLVGFIGLSIGAYELGQKKFAAVSGPETHEVEGDD